MKLPIALAIAALLATLSGCGQNKTNDSSGKATQDHLITKPVENIVATPAQRERRNRSEAFCRARNIPVYHNPNSLFVETDEKTTIRSQNEVVDRALALCYVALKGEGLEQDMLDKMDKDYHISAKLSPEEKSYATASSPTDQQKTDAVWRYESLDVLLWALGYTDSLIYPDKSCDVATDVGIIHDLNEKDFRQKARLRSKKEILDQADLILRLHWACVEARLKNATAPAGLEEELVFERHRILNWLINYMNQDWDDVVTDT